MKLSDWMKYIRPYLRYFLLSPVAILIEAVGEVILPKLLAVVINSANAGTLTAGISMRVMVLMIVTAIAMMAGGIGGAYFSTKASVHFAADLRSDLYSRVQAFSFANIDHFSTGSLVTRLTNDVTQMQNVINMLLRLAMRAPFMMIAALIMAIRIKPSLSVVFAVSLPLMLITLLLIIRTGFPRFGRLQDTIDGVNAEVQENVTNIRVVKSFVREDYSIAQFHSANGALKNAALSAWEVVIFMQPVMTLFMNATTIAVILLGGRIVLNGGMAVGDLSAFVTYVSQILISLVMLTMVLMTSSRAIASGKRIAEVLTEEPDLNDDNAARKDAAVKNGSIEFRNVSFRYYKNSEGCVLDHISLSIPAGTTVGIIGSTGSGKSTLVSLIPRLYDPDEGSVLVDGIDVRDYSLTALRDGIGMVLQKNTLFSGSIAENLRWGDAEATDEQVTAAAEHAQADGFIRTFPEGYDSILTQGGTNVSGGQKQRLCIARALLKRPHILILDDSTSAVDTATEAMIRKAFREDLAGSTKLIIAQRITSVMDADLIVVMNDGAVTATGTHAELLKTSEEYREIYDSQTKKEA